MDHFVWRLSVCLFCSHTLMVVFLFLVTHSYVSQATHAFLGMLRLCFNTSNIDTHQLFVCDEALLKRNLKYILYSMEHTKGHVTTDLVLLQWI